MAVLVFQLENGMIEATEFRDKLRDVIKDSATATDELGQIDQVGFGTVLKGLGDLVRMLTTVAQKGAEASASIPGSPSGNSGLSRNPFDVGGYENPDMVIDSGRGTRPPPSAPALVDESGTVSTSGGGGGGGGRSSSRVDALIADLQTEREILEDWYQESLEMLNGATDAQLEVLGGRHEAIERLEAEHKDRMLALQDAKDRLSLEGVLGAGADILGAMGAHSQKALKISQGFAAAEALISAYKGAAKELEKGTLGFAAAAAVIAKGMAFIAAIRSAKADSSSASGSTGSTTAAAAAAYQPPTVNLTWVGDLSQSGMETLTEKLNREYKQGYRLNFVQR